MPYQAPIVLPQKEKKVSNKLEDVLRSHCNLIDWHPTSLQLENIKNDIKQLLKVGVTLSIADCQRIIVKHCGSTQMLVTKGVDNSDLNTLLAIAIASVEQGS
jgi:hypothetical protein